MTYRHVGGGLATSRANSGAVARKKILTASYINGYAVTRVRARRWEAEKRRHKGHFKPR